MTLIGDGLKDGYLSVETIESIVMRGLDSLQLEGKRVILLIPDTTRTMPMPFMFALLEKYLLPRVSKLDYLVALGTHPPLDDDQLSQLVGRQVTNGKAGGSHIFNHAWDKPASYAHIGTLTKLEIEQLTDGLFSCELPVQLNKRILEYDQVIICGPVFPHEVVGFSGGNKYLFPGIAGQDIINFTHWLGALLTSYRLIGTMDTPVRSVIDRAASLVPIPVACFALVVTGDGVAGVFFGPAKEAWRAAAGLSAERHIVYKPQPFKRVLSIMPAMYTDLWTAAKGMYKLEPVIADGGEVIIYAPHIHEVSFTHGDLINQLGYHCRDFFLKQWDRYQEYPGGVLAHLTHLKGLGTYDPSSRVETPRIQVTLATSIPAERCQRLNLGYLDPATVDLATWQDREDAGFLVVPNAGELLYRLENSVIRQKK